MKTTTINQFGITLKVGRNKRGILKTEVHSILDAFDETPSSFYAWCEKEALFSKPGWLTNKQLSDFLMFLAKHNEAAGDFHHNLSIKALQDHPELMRDAQDFVQQHLAETGDRIVGENWKHPLAEVHQHNGEPVINLYGAATLMLHQIVGGNEGAKANFDKIIFSYNPLINLKSLHHGISSRFESQWLQACSLFAEAIESIAQK